MTSLPSFPRLEAQLGVPLADITSTNLGRLVDLGVSEDEQLDFKRAPWDIDNDSDDQPSGDRWDGKKELGKDVCAFANRSGGVIVVGMREKSRLATALLDVELSDGMENAIKEAVIKNCFPFPEFYVRAVPSPTDPTRGQWLLIVPPSPLAPHAVRLSDRSLRFPSRRGTTTDWLAESQVADQYRSRFESAARDADRLDTVFREGSQDLPSQSFPWLVTAVTPNRRRLGSLDRELSSSIFTAIRNAPDELLNNGSRLRNATPTVGLRRVRAALPIPDKPNRLLNAHLHSDGSTFFAYELTTAHQLDKPLEDACAISLRWLASIVVEAVRLSAQHAVDLCGAGGDALVRLALLDPWEEEGRTRPLPIPELERGGLLNRPPAIDREIVVDHTIDLNSAAPGGLGWMQTSRILLTDLVQACGVVEPSMITPDGQLVPHTFGDYRKMVSDWAKDHDVPTI